MTDRRTKLRRLTYGGLLAALITLLTAVFRIVLPPFGYYHIGDGAVLLAGMLLGPYGAFPAAVGAGLADLLAGALIRTKDGVTGRNVGVLLLAGLWHIAGHLVADALVYSSFGVAVSLIAGNVVQALIALALGCALLNAPMLFPDGLRA